MEALGSDGEALFREIAERALARNQARAALLASVLREDSLDAAERAEAVALAHQVAGSAGTFGYGDASELARHACVLLTGGATPRQVRGAVERLVAALQEPPAPGQD